MVFENVWKWTKGSVERVVPPKSRADAHLLLLPPRQQADQATELTENCVAATSLLPLDAMAGLAVVRGALHRYTITRDGVVLESVPTTPAQLQVSELLAVTRPPLPQEVLALAQTANAVRPQLWTFSLRGDQAVGQPADDRPAFRDKNLFFEQFAAPRCRNKDTDCVVLHRVDEHTYVGIESKRGEPRRGLRSLGPQIAHDAVWQPGQRGAMLLLLACP